MSYETVIEQIQKTPEQYLDEISYYIDFINYREQKKSQEKKVSAAKRFFEVADLMHGNSHGQKWTKEELHER